MIDTEKQGKLRTVILGMSNARVLVVGDIMLDEYVWSEVKRISPEAPVPIASVTGVSYFLGGASNVAHNARALGAEVALVGVIGDDAEGARIIEMLDEKGIDGSGILKRSGHHTSHKRRIMAGTQQLIRIDREETGEIEGEVLLKLKDTLLTKIKETDVVIISDYCKGILTHDLIESIKNFAKQEGKKVFVDSKNKHFFLYKDVFLIKPNREEAELFAGERFHDDYRNLESIGKKLGDMFNAHVVITLGKDGTALFSNNEFLRKATHVQQVFDVSGAGDTVLSALATAVASGATLEEAVELSNVAAGYVVSCLGTTVCDADVLLRRLEENV